jgi:hypothetical protein
MTVKELKEKLEELSKENDIDDLDVRIDGEYAWFTADTVVLKTSKDAHLFIGIM